MKKKTLIEKTTKHGMLVATIHHPIVVAIVWSWW